DDAGRRMRRPRRVSDGRGGAVESPWDEALAVRASGRRRDAGGAPRRLRPGAERGALRRRARRRAGARVGARWRRAGGPPTGPALVWELGDGGPAASLSADVHLDPAVRWIVRCDRIDFPPGGVAYRHTHPGPGIRRLLYGSLRIETGTLDETYGPGGAWFEGAHYPGLPTAPHAAGTPVVRPVPPPGGRAGKAPLSHAPPRTHH